METAPAVRPSAMPTGPGPTRVELLVATTNTGKLREIREALAGPTLEIVTLADYADIEPPEEVGSTFAENARAKALYYSARTSLLTAAEDSGLEVDALGGAPGVQSSRFGGAGTPYPQKFQLLYDALHAAGSIDSPARFVCAVALVQDGRVVFEARGTIEGQVARTPKGQGGFGYDPIFYYPPYGCTLAEAGERKLAVSHRARAFARLKEFLERRPDIG
ncbi:MAG: non-canonical purine NTP pyrophosphatase [Acidobacteria bacterium]|nr:MAG: non-canonical purine NTP pyrophosphatase [Acidobacteriota bacterium]PYR49205.1 MAG: non-canonical purine NTP pyrophosphatase [Acidobacteriota bacterium]